MTRTNSINIIQAVKNLAIIAFIALCFHFIILMLTASGVSKIKIKIESFNDGFVQVFYTNQINRNNYSEKRSYINEIKSSDGKTELTFALNNFIVNSFRIDPLMGEGKIKIYSISINSSFYDSKILSAKDIFSMFNTNSECSLSLKNDHVEVISTGGDPQLIYNQQVKFFSPFFLYAMPVFLSIIFFITLKSISIKKIPAFRDIDSKAPSSQDNIRALDGLRGFAAILVLADHSNYIYFKGLGAIGVWIFFCLSGFLLSTPFARNPSRVSSISYVGNYLTRRVKRIVPMYYFILTTTYLFGAKLETFLRHILFIQGDRIFWSVPQEMLFYSILPFIFYFNYYILKGSFKLSILFTFALAIYFNHYFYQPAIFIFHDGGRLKLWTGIFLSGVCLSYVYHSPFLNYLKRIPFFLLNTISIVFFLIVLLSSDALLGSLFRENRPYTWIYTSFYGYLSALLILFIASNRRLLISQFMSCYALRAAGIVGFSFYLVHVNVLNMIRQIYYALLGSYVSEITLFFVGLFMTYMLSVVTYSLIEKPFLGSVHRNNTNASAN